jgi:hypothetical protein
MLVRIRPLRLIELELPSPDEGELLEILNYLRGQKPTKPYPNGLPEVLNHVRVQMPTKSTSGEEQFPIPKGAVGGSGASSASSMLAIWFDPAVADPWPWLRTAVRWQCRDAWPRRARETTASRSISTRSSTPVTLEAGDPTEGAEPPGPSFDEVLRAAVTGAPQDARASLPRYVVMWRDHEIARDQGIVDLGALARHYFGKDAKQNRYRVNQCCKRVKVRLEHAARHSGTANVPVETVEVLDDAPAGNALGTRRQRCWSWIN